MKRTITPLLLFCAALLCAPLASWAVPVAVPTDLNPGDQYRLVFVTSTMRDATSSDIADYNAFVTAAANSVSELAALGTTWKAIASTSATDARDNTDTNPDAWAGVPVFDLIDQVLATNNSEVWDEVFYDGGLQIFVNESATALYFEEPVWTGTTNEGFAAENESYSLVLGSSTSSAVVGYADFPGNSDYSWIAHDDRPSSENHRFYAMSGILTVVPEPGTMMLAGFGATAVVGWQLRRRRHRYRLWHHPPRPPLTRLSPIQGARS